MSKFTRIPLPKIKQAAMKMAEAVKPEKIILFGSYAYGRPDRDSDVDFLLVLEEKSRKRRREAFLKASEALMPRPFSVDIVVRSAKDISSRMKEGGDFFLEEVMEKGRLLYER